MLAFVVVQNGSKNCTWSACAAGVGALLDVDIRSISLVCLQAPATLQPSSKAAVHKKLGISLTSPDAKLIKRWHTALSRCRGNVGSTPAVNAPTLKRASTMLPGAKSAAN